jgi:5-methylcytosine-specific restriction protein A
MSDAWRAAHTQDVARAWEGIVATHLLAWNPTKYRWGSLEDELRGANGTSSLMGWSVGNVRNIQPGDRLFLIRLGQDPRGIVGSGWARCAPYTGPHWNPTRAAAGDVTKRIDLDFDYLDQEPRIPMAQLRQSDTLRSYHWSTQMSGVRIPDDVAAALEDAWASVVDAQVTGFPDQPSSAAQFPEGAAVQVYVNRYERNPAARQACIAHYGRACSVCGMTFGGRYGATARRFIQVHHLSPLGETRTPREVDPVEDMRPVCPNCHAVLHLTKPALTIERAKRLMAVAADGA